MTAITEKHFYGRRRNRGLHMQRQQAFDVVSGKYLVTAPETETFDPLSYFNGMTPSDLWLEIGFGYGEHLVNQASLHPDIGILGVEPFINGIAVASLGIVEKDLTNIRIYPDDAMHLLPKFKDGCFSKIFLFFPDPWPKTRHHKRRFVQPETVAIFARLLKANGTLHLATDIPDLADWMLMHVMDSNLFDWTADRQDDWLSAPKDWVMTKYQSKAIDVGRSSYYLDFVKRS